MANEEIRERRLQRFAMLERARAEARQQQAAEQASGEPSSSSKVPQAELAQQTAKLAEATHIEPGNSGKFDSGPRSQPSSVSESNSTQNTQNSSTQTNSNTQHSSTQNLNTQNSNPQSNSNTNSNIQVNSNTQVNSNSQKNPPTVRPATIRKPAKQPISVAWLFNLLNGENPKWEDIEDVHGMLWELVSEREKPLTYLIEVFHRASQLEKDYPDVTAELSTSIASLAYIIAMVDKGEYLYQDIASALLETMSSEKLTQEFVTLFLSTLHKEDEDIFHEAVTGCVALLRQSFEFFPQSATSIFRVLGFVLAYPPAAEYALELPKPLGTSKTLTIDQIDATMLGKILNLGIAPYGLMQVYLPSVLLKASDEELGKMVADIEPMTRLLETLQFGIVSKLIRQSEKTRNLTLRWFEMVLEANHGQTASHRQPLKVNNYQFMLNAFKMLLELSAPFVKLGTSLSSPDLLKQLSKINRDYFAFEQSYDISSETKILAEENAPFNSRSRTEPLNFVTRCFFLTAGYLHYGFQAIVQTLNGVMRQRVDHVISVFEEFENAGRLPAELGRVHEGTFMASVVFAKAEYAGIQWLVHDLDFIGSTLRFAKFVMAFNAYAAQNGPADGIKVDVPWEIDPPENYKSYPEFLLEETIVSISFIIRESVFLRNSAVAGSNNELLFDTAIFFMSSPLVVHNPYLRSKFVEILYFGGTDVFFVNGACMPGPMSGLFTSSDICRSHLMPALMSVFIDIEHTGRTGQFYEKFTTRELVASVMQVLWRDPHYRNQLVGQSHENPDFFVKFVALLLNDATYLLDEALGKVLALKKLESGDGDAAAAQGNGTEVETNRSDRASQQQNNDDQMENGEAEDENEQEEERESPEARLRSAERSAKNFLDLSRTTVTLLNTFTAAVPDIFATPEIIDRFAVMLNYNLAILVGPKCRELKLKNPLKIGFSPKDLLSNLIRVYLNLRDEPPFPKAIAKDERSYNATTMERALTILRKHNLLSPVDCDHFAELAVKTREAWDEAQAEEEEFGDDIPDEYLDPLMYTLMENPVILPTSKVNIDLSTIKTHLLSDPTDPFNRVPLKIEEVVPNDDLRKEIEEFKRQRKSQRASDDKMTDN